MAKYYSKQKLIQALREVAEKTGRVPQPTDMTEPTAKIILGYFKKWSKAIKAADIQSRVQAAFGETASAVTEDEGHVESTDAEVQAKEKTVIEGPMIVTVPEKAAASKEDEAPTEEIIQADMPCTRRYSKSIITKMLLSECNRLGKKPTRKEIDENKDLPTVSTILKYFETTRIGDVWAEVLK